MKTTWSQQGVGSCELPLTKTQVERLAGRWGDNFGHLWRDIETLAGDVWAAGDSDFAKAWHHFLMSVGNFKRQRGAIIYASNVELDQSTGTRSPRDEVTVPASDGGTVVLNRIDSSTWRGWGSAVNGLGVPTATTALSALWPGEHVIIDKLDFRATVGLVVAAGGNILKDSRSSKSLDRGWEEYGWFRPFIISESNRLGVEPVTLERALFFAGALIESVKGRPWETYGQALIEKIEKVCS